MSNSVHSLITSVPPPRTNEQDQDIYHTRTVIQKVKFQKNVFISLQNKFIFNFTEHFKEIVIDQKFRNQSRIILE